MLGRENLKLNKTQVMTMMNLLHKEEELELEEKRLEKEEKLKESGGTQNPDGHSGSSTQAVKS